VLLRVLCTGIYAWFIVNWQAFWGAIIDSMFALSQATNAKDLLLQPGLVWQLGQQVTAGIGKYHDFWTGEAATWNFAVSPRDGILFLLALGSFFVMTIHFGMIPLETSIAIGVGIVLFPWSLVRSTGFLGEAVIGWLAGCAIRVLILAVLLAAAFPLFTTIAPPASVGTTFVDPMSGVAFPAMAPSMGETFGVGVGAMLFAFLVLIIPARAARLMAGPALALSASDLLAGAMTTFRFTLAGTRIIRGTSALLTGGI
jgi:hypothetical protein